MGNSSAPVIQRAFQKEIAFLRKYVAEFADSTPDELRSIVSYQLGAVQRSKFFRPLLAWGAVRERRMGEAKLRRAALAIQLLHESSLIVDDMIDRSRFRRDQLAAHCLFSRPVAMSAAMWFALRACELIDESYPKTGTKWLIDMGRQVALAETLQWTHRNKHGKDLLPLVRRIAEGDTAALFVLSARLGGATEIEQRDVVDLGVSYHWLDDAQAILKRGVFGGRETDPDERDGICTLVAALGGDADKALKHVRAMIVSGKKSKVNWTRPFWQNLHDLARA